ncbi:MAG: glutathione S-transferase family protein [Rhodobacteraceae bacterium]|nr:glutathione S-transferase family protein [Paracoccaceae bacterium]
MLTFHHAPLSRSGRVHWLLHELDVPFEMVRCDIPRRDGTGARDPRNPHPEGKVPALEHDGALITETAAILLYLTDLFPERRLGVAPGEPGRGAYLTWLFWYAGVVEPVYLAAALGVADHPVARASFRGPEAVAARLIAALEGRDWLMGERFTAADILLCSPYLYFPDATPDHPAVRGWIARCTARPAYQASLERD